MIGFDSDQPVSLSVQPALRQTVHAKDSGEIEITPGMIEAGLRVLRNSGVLEYDDAVNERLMRTILWVAFASR